MCAVTFPKPRKSRLPPPPGPDDTLGNLEQPEHAPSIPTPAPTPTSTATPSKAEPPRVDGRTLQVTGRTLHFANKVTPQWKAQLHRLAQRTGLMYCEVLEHALDALERELDARHNA